MTHYAFTPNSHNWRIYDEDGSTALANENVKPTGVGTTDAFVIHWCIHETGGDSNGSNLDIVVEYSDDQSTWYTLGGQGATDKKFRWDDNPNITEHATVTSKISCQTQLGLYHEAACVDNCDITAGTHHELAICVEGYNPSGNTTYYFRISLEAAYPPLEDPPNSYPQIQTEALTPTYHIHYSHNVGAGWITPETVDSEEASTEYRWPSIALNSSDDPFIAYQDITNTDLWVAKRTGVDTYSRNETSTDCRANTGENHGDCCLVVTTDGYPHVVWTLNSDASKIRHAWYTSFPSGLSSEQVVDAPEQAWSPTLATDGTTKLYVFYEGKDTGDTYLSIWIIKKENGGWTGNAQVQDGEADGHNWRYPVSKWSYYNNTGASNQVDYVFRGENEIYWDKYALLATYNIDKTSDARIKNTYAVDKNSDARIKNTYEVDKTSDARVLRTEEVDKTSDSRILRVEEIDKTSDARVENTYQIDKTSDAVVVLTYEIDKYSDARIKNTYVVDKTSDARIKNTYQVDKTSDARVVLTYEVDKYSDARIKNTYAVDKTSDARVKNTYQIDKTSDARIVFTYEVDKTSDARIFKTSEIDKFSDARILRTEQIDKTSDARVVLTYEVDKYSDARIKATLEIDKNTDARVLRVEEIDKNSDARILRTEEIDKTSDARIFKTSQIDKTSDAKIVTTVTYNINKTSDATIWAGQTRTQKDRIYDREAQIYTQNNPIYTRY